MSYLRIFSQAFALIMLGMLAITQYLQSHQIDNWILLFLFTTLVIIVMNLYEEARDKTNHPTENFSSELKEISTMLKREEDLHDIRESLKYPWEGPPSRRLQGGRSRPLKKRAPRTHAAQADSLEFD